MSSSDPTLPLQGIRVLEVGGSVPAAFATRWLTGYGAAVVRSEGRKGALTSDEEAFLLPGKRRVSVDARELRALALEADLVVEDGPPGALAALGLDPRELRSAKPSLVVTSLTSGRTGRTLAGRRATSWPTLRAESCHSPVSWRGRRSRTAAIRRGCCSA